MKQCVVCFSFSSLRFTSHYGEGRNLDAQRVKNFATAAERGAVEDQEHVRRIYTLQLLEDGHISVESGN